MPSDERLTMSEERLPGKAAAPRKDTASNQSSSPPNRPPNMKQEDEGCRRPADHQAISSRRQCWASVRKVARRMSAPRTAFAETYRQEDKPTLLEQLETGRLLD